MIDMEASIDFMIACDTAFLFEDAYIVIYEIGTPWYAASGTLMLNELSIMRVGQGSAFDNVLSFLEDKAREAGAVLVGVGTALTRTDRALASVYMKAGYRQEAIVLAKRLDG